MSGTKSMCGRMSRSMSTPSATSVSSTPAPVSRNTAPSGTYTASRPSLRPAVRHPEQSAGLRYPVEQALFDGQRHLVQPARLGERVDHLGGQAEADVDHRAGGDLQSGPAGDDGAYRVGGPRLPGAPRHRGA